MNRNPSRQGIPFVLSGPSGCGKGTIVKALLEKYPDQFALSVSATTRAPRPGEENGVHYHFISGEEFERRIAEDEILEYTTYCGNYYGTLRPVIEKDLCEGKNVILEIEVDGAMQIKKKFPEAVLVLVVPPDFATLEARLRGRGTNTEEDIKNRLLTAKREIAVMKDYDYVVINEDGGAEIAAKEIAGIIFAEQHKIERCPEAAKAFIG